LPYGYLKKKLQWKSMRDNSKTNCWFYRCFLLPCRTVYPVLIANLIVICIISINNVLYLCVYVVVYITQGHRDTACKSFLSLLLNYLLNWLIDWLIIYGFTSRSRIFHLSLLLNWIVSWPVSLSIMNSHSYMYMYYLSSCNVNSNAILKIWGRHFVRISNWLI
jgi:hypothetical protein